MPIANPGVTRTTEAVAQVTGESTILLPGIYNRHAHHMRPERIVVTWTVSPRGETRRKVRVYGPELKKDGTAMFRQGAIVFDELDDKAPEWVHRAVEDLSELAPFAS